MTKEMHEFYLVTPEQLIETADAAFTNHTAGITFEAVSRTIMDIDRRAKIGEPMRCMVLDCDFKFDRAHKPMAFGVIVPMFPDRGCVIAHGICEKCFDRSDLRQQIVTALREFFPNGAFGDISRTRQ